MTVFRSGVDGEGNRHRNSLVNLGRRIHRPVDRGRGAIAVQFEPHQPPAKFGVSHVPGREVSTEIEKCTPGAAHVRHAEPGPELAARQIGGRKFKRHADDGGLVTGIGRGFVERHAAALVGDTRT